MLKSLIFLKTHKEFLYFQKIQLIIKRNNSKMSIFIQKHNPLTGKDDWVVREENYDYHQEVARSSFADMLHDTERNQMYEQALKSAIDIMHSRGKKANVLDIGTGTGLLSMMAARNGADTITACEAFKPMSECAKKIIERNGFNDLIRIIPKRSTDLIVGENGDLSAKCNILVTEVFDTELIGEGALKTFIHAREVLLEDDCIVVPESAKIYAQIVECPLAQSWNKLKNIFSEDGELLLKIPKSIMECPGAVAVHDLQLNQLNSTDFKTIVSPTVVFEFDWSGKIPLKYDRCNFNKVVAEKSGIAQVVFMWWDLKMDTKGEIILSCAPFWAHPLGDKQPKDKLPWRDHWMQAIYYLPQEINVQKGDILNLVSSHDEFSLWFNLRTNLSDNSIEEQPICNCGLHVLFSRTRIGQLNDLKQNKRLQKILNKIEKNQNVLVLGNGFYSSLIASKLGVNLFYIENNNMSRNIMNDFVRTNSLKNVRIVEEPNQLGDIKIDVVIGEPYFLTSILPWDNLMFISTLKTVRSLLKEDVKIFPKLAKIKGIAINFKDLHKIRLPLGECEGFEMKFFDHLIENSSNISDDSVEPQPLWEYPGIALSDIVEVCSIDCTKFDDTILESQGQIRITQGLGGCNGIALWVEWVLDDTDVYSTGPVIPTEIGKQIEWYKNTRQGVCLFSNRNAKEIDYKFKLDFNEGDIHFKCS